MASATTATSLFSTRTKPFLIYGTAWKKEQTARLVSEAIRHDFRAIDTACQPKHYNEPGVGDGWSTAATELGLSRGDIFLQTKFTSLDGQDPARIPYDPRAALDEQVRQSVAASLRNLRTDYVDSLVLHSPLRSMNDTLLVWRVFEEMVEAGKTRHIGISNCYASGQFVQLYEAARIKPAVLQNRFYDATDFDTKLRAFCAANSVWYQSFWTLSANRSALARPDVKRMADRKQLTPQTLMYAFLMSLGYVTPLCGTTSKKHMEEDIALVKRMHAGDTVFESDAEKRQFAQILGMAEL